MERNKYLRQKPLTLAEQAYFLRTVFPAFSTSIKHGKLKCLGELRPTLTSDIYTVELLYRVPNRPKIKILAPPLRIAPTQKKLPHVFGGDELCLYLEGEWRPELPISDYMIGWVSEWLAFYEDWVVTGVWMGGGHEPMARGI